MSTTFQNACMQGDVDIVRKFLNHEDPIYKMEATVVNQAGSNPMQLATWMQQDEVIKVLLEHGAEPLSVEEDKKLRSWAPSCDENNPYAKSKFLPPDDPKSFYYKNKKYGYVSPEEQEILDAKKKEEEEKAAEDKARRDAEFEASQAAAKAEADGAASEGVKSKVLSK